MDPIIYKTPQRVRIITGLSSAVILVILNFVLLQQINMPATIGVGFGLYFAIGYKLSITNDRVAVKPFIGKATEYAFADGTFALVELTGAQAWMAALKPKTTVLQFTPHGTGSTDAKTIVAMLSEQEYQTIYEQIQERSKSA